MSRYGMVIVFIMSLIGTVEVSEAKLPRRITSILCAFGPDMNVVTATFPKGENACDAYVKIQGYYYQCELFENLMDTRIDFLKKLNDQAKEVCEEFCEQRGSSCAGEYRRQSQCAFSYTDEQALHEGSGGRCHLGCEGPAMAYCSLYHSSFQKTTPNMIKLQSPNCHCKVKKDKST